MMSLAQSRVTVPFRPASTRRPRTSNCVRAAAPQINQSVKKDEPKVVDTVLTSSIEKPVAYCRCWQSKTFPLCDASHNKFNKETGDNVGPLMIKKG